MKFMIGEKVYDAEAGISKASLSTVYELKVRTGVGMKTLATQAQRLTEFADPMDMLEDKEAFQTFRIIIWLARKHAGENHLTLDQATDFPMDSFMILLEEEELEPDPKADSEADASADEVTSPTT